MLEKVKRLVLLVVIITITISNIAYAQTQLEPVPFGPKVTDLKNKEDILNNLQQIKSIRSSLTTIDIRLSSTPEELKSTGVQIDNYIQQMEDVRANLRNHIITYKGSFPDEFFAEQIIFIADSYTISLRHQQLLANSLQNNIEEAKTLFYSSYMIPVYFYMTKADEMVAYIDIYVAYS